MTDTVAPAVPPIADDARRDLPAFVHAGEHRMWIGGAFVPARSGATLPTTDPTTELPLARIPHGDATDVDAAVTAARSGLADPACTSKN